MAANFALMPHPRLLMLVTVCLFTFFCVQLLFVSADPHNEVSTSRGPLTDEGLNTFQARNYVNTGNWGMDEGDNLIKSPLYNGYLAGVMSIFDSSRKTLRLATLIGSLLLIGWFLLKIKSYLLPVFLTLIAGFQFHLFQFFHFSMVEMLVNGCALVAVAFATIYLQTGSSRQLLLSYLMLYICFLLKIQYAYLLALPFVMWLVGALSKNDKKYWHTLIKLTITAGASVALFYVAWYLPFQEIFNTVWAHQGADRFAGNDAIIRVFTDSGKYLVWGDRNIWFAIAFALSIPPGIYYLKGNHPLRYLLIATGIWVVLELHKMFILYLPTRYALSLFLAMGLWMATVICLTIVSWQKSDKQTSELIHLLAAILILIPVLAGNLFNFNNVLRQRTYNSEQIIAEYEDYNFEDKTIVGVWATTLIWNPTAHIIPVWKNFLNDDDILQKVKPPLVVTEKDEADSEQVFSSRGIDLKALSDSNAQHDYGRYKVNFYFMSY